MKKILAVTLLALTTPAKAQALEADLDGNAGALLASEFRPAPKPVSGRGAAVPGPRADRVKTGTVASGALVQRRAN